MIGPLELLYAFLLDILIGDPRWLPHPVRIIGKGISGAEGVLRRFFKTSRAERWAGILLVLSITLPVYIITDCVTRILIRHSVGLVGIFGTLAIIYLTATTIAAHDLVRHAQLVVGSIKNRDLASARQQVGMIVGRDTQELSEKDVLKATIESLAENLSDGVIAPLFYLMLGGLPLAMTYKAVNTLDSMVGYKNEKYRYLGWAAARLDDIANYLPARITGYVIVCSVFLFTLLDRGGKAFPVAQRSFRIMVRDGRKHSSPNSGVPEAAMAGALGVRLGGPSTYGGVLHDKPYIGDEETDDYLSASYDAKTLVKFSFAIAGCVTVVIAAIRSFS
jgi:adenosylcobinamide-phosphate synthase